MPLILLILLALLLPGIAVARRVFPDLVRGGLLGLIAVGHVCTLTILAPVSIVGYMLNWPVAVLQWAIAAMIVAGVLDMVIVGWWRELSRQLGAALSLGLLILLADLACGLLVGAHTDGDAIYHLARIRFLLDNGLSNQHIYFEFPAWDHFYHTNLWHALLAACAGMAGSDHFAAWSVSLAWVKLLIASSYYFAAWCVYDRPWAGWAAAVAAVASLAPSTILAYPNQFGSHVFICFGIGLLARMSWAPGWRPAALLAAISFLLGQIHGLYAIFAGLALVGPLAILFTIHAVRRTRRMWPIAGGIVALWAALPFILLTHTSRATRDEAEPTAAATAAAPAQLKPHRAFRQWADGTFSLRWHTFSAAHVGLAIGLVGGLLTRRRRAVAMVGLTGLLVMVMLHTPLLCTALGHVLQALWILGRFNVVPRIVAILLMAGWIGYALDPLTRRSWSGPWRFPRPAVTTG